VGPYRTNDALKNLKKGVKKMEKNMSPAARVRRDFRLGRPPKGQLPLHPRVAWEKADSLLTDLRKRMQEAGLRMDHVKGEIVAIRDNDPDEPVFVSVAKQEAAIETLSAPNIIALGCVFRQFDEQMKQGATFFVQFTGLSERGLAVLKKAAEKRNAVVWSN